MSGNSFASRSRVLALVLLAAAEPAIRGRSPVGQQQGAGRVEVAGQEPGQGRRDVPGAGGEVDHRGAGVLAGQPFVEHRHARGRRPGVLVDHEGVPGRQQRAGQSGHHHRVVDVGHRSRTGPAGRPRRRRRSDVGALGAEPDLVPARGQIDVDLDVDDAAGVGLHGRARRHPTCTSTVAFSTGTLMKLRQPARAGRLVRPRRAGPGQQDPAEDPQPVGRAVAGVRDDVRDGAGLARRRARQRRKARSTRAARCISGASMAPT